MSNKLLMTVAVAAFAVGAAGCTTTDDTTNAQVNGAVVQSTTSAPMIHLLQQPMSME